MAKTFTKGDVASHNKGDDLYIIVDDDVYDLTKFQEDHPGGKKILTRVAGKDATKQFWKYHNQSILNKYKPTLLVGSLDSKPKDAAPAAAAPEVKPSPVYAAPEPAKKIAKSHDKSEPLSPFGDLIPYADPSWYQSVSPHDSQDSMAVCQPEMLTSPL